jgi:hypothetical protein
MRVVNHVLVKHSVRVAQNKGRLVFIVQRVVRIINNFAISSKKHCVDNGLTLFLMVNPPLLPLKSERKNIPHLLGIAKKRSKTAITARSAAP